MGHLGHLSRPGHRVTGSSFWPGVRPEFFRFSKKCPKCKTYIWNVKMTKVIVRCLLLDWNHWMSVLAMNFYFYIWLLKILWPENTSSHMSRHLEFITEQGHQVNWVSGSLDSRVTGSLGHIMWVFPVFEKNAQNAKRTFEMLKWQKSLSGVCCWTEITGCQCLQWTFTFTYDY